ncbi:MAG TPA: putative Ig domain-containing protein [Steroidobacteraceae bacterium]
MCNGCGGGGGSSDTAAPAAASPPPVTAPAVTNRAPTISGQVIDSVRVGETYVWQPVAADPDGDAMHFSATNLPPWASLDPTSGVISGTPGETDVGVYEEITITVADAGQQAATSPFSITVIGDVGTGVASLQWETPPSKVDGSPLDDLAGFRILYGRNSDDLDHSVIIDSPSTTSYDFTSLTTGIWYFTVVAVNAGGLEGPPTTVATKSI